MALDTASLSALSALAGSGIGALASVATTWLTQHTQSREKRLSQEAARRERLFVNFVDQASQTYADGMVLDGLDDPSRLVPLYATINKLRLFAARDTVQSAEQVLDTIVETFETPGTASKIPDAGVAAHDVLRTFAELSRAELKALR